MSAVLECDAPITYHPRTQIDPASQIDPGPPINSGPPINPGPPIDSGQRASEAPPKRPAAAPAQRTIASNPLAVMDASTPVIVLVRAAQDGDRDAFGLLFQRYRAGIVALAMRRLRHADEAEELAQDVFVQAMQKIGQLRVPEAFGGWLRQIVHRMALNRIARRQSTTMACDPQVLEATCLSSDDSPEACCERNEQAAGVRAAVERLGERDRLTLQAFYLGGQSLVQMSDSFDAPVGTIKRRLHDARKRLANEMALAESKA